MTLWMVNPANPAKKTRKRATGQRKRKPPAGFRTWKEWGAHMQRLRKRKARPSGRSTTRKRTTKRRVTVPARKRTARRRTTAKRRTPRRRATRRRTVAKRRAYRRNPSIRGIGKTLMDGVVHGGVIVAGKAGGRIILNQIAPLINKEDPAAVSASPLWQVGSALLVGMLGNMVLPSRFRPFFVAGALTAPIEQFARNANIPILSPALSGYPAGRFRVVAGEGARSLGAYANRGMGAYANRPRLGAIPFAVRTGPTAGLGNPNAESVAQYGY